jgi:hypothetical protein
MFKRKITTADYFVILINLIPLWGVWFAGWDPKQMFLIYCCESILLGFFTILKMLIVTQIKKKEEWNENSGEMVSGYFFILFFIVHYGFFISIQLMFFFGASKIIDAHSPLQALFELPSVLDGYTRAMLWGFVGIYALRMITEFILTGQYHRISLGVLMFSPYIRIVVQQFVVILGGLILSLGAGKIFMLVFVLVKIAFEVLLNYDRTLQLADKKQKIETAIKHTKNN